MFFHCYVEDRPSGGQKDTYRHVDALNALGYDAYVFHEQSGHRLTWFDHETRIIDRDEFLRLVDPKRDYVVLPEDLGCRILQYPGTKKVVFNKSIWTGFSTITDQRTELSPYRHPDVIAALVMSRHNAAHLAYAYPRLPTFIVKPHIDGDLFSPQPLCGRRKRIVYVPKVPRSVAVLHHMLAARAMSGEEHLRDLQWLALVDLPEREVATVLQESLLLVFFSAEEGLGRIVLEATSAGCLVMGFRNGTLQEILPPEMQFEWGDLISVAKGIEKIVRHFPDQIEEYELIAAKSQARAREYSADAHRESVSAAWQQILQLG